jgi:hypothetical protein
MRCGVACPPAVWIDIPARQYNRARAQIIQNIVQEGVYTHT